MISGMYLFEILFFRLNVTIEFYHRPKLNVSDKRLFSRRRKNPGARWRCKQLLHYFIGKMYSFVRIEMHHHFWYRKHRFVAFIEDLIKKIEKNMYFQVPFSCAHEDVWFSNEAKKLRSKWCWNVDDPIELLLNVNMIINLIMTLTPWCKIVCVNWENLLVHFTTRLQTTIR